MPNRKDHAFRRLTIYAGEASVVVTTDFMQEASERLLDALKDRSIDPTGCLYRFAKKMESAVATAERLSQKRSELDKGLTARESNGLRSIR
jgi:hypothetical protein